MSRRSFKGVEDARRELPTLLDAARDGASTIITRHGRPVAAIVPLDEQGRVTATRSLLPMAGSGRGLWGRNPQRSARRLRSEWER
jgi:prevent-host-death family protein